jgi:hypothetical protein
MIKLTLADFQTRVAKAAHTPMIGADGRHTHSCVADGEFSPRHHEHAANADTGPARHGAPKNASVSPVGGFPVHDGMTRVSRGTVFKGADVAVLNSYPQAASPNAMDELGYHPKERSSPAAKGMRSRVGETDNAQPGYNAATNKPDDLVAHYQGRRVLTEGLAGAGVMHRAAAVLRVLTKGK